MDKLAAVVLLFVGVLIVLFLLRAPGPAAWRWRWLVVSSAEGASTHKTVKEGLGRVRELYLRGPRGARIVLLGRSFDGRWRALRLWVVTKGGAP